MGKIITFKKLWKRKDKRGIIAACYNHIICTRILDILNDEQYLKITYRVVAGKKLNLISPKTFNEKLQWLKLHDRNPLYTKLVDKYTVKEYVAEKIGEEYIIPTLGIWNHFDEIDFTHLPDKFVLKCTHDSGGLIIVNDKRKLDQKRARKRLESCLRRNYYYVGREWPYKNVEPRILAEKYLEFEANGEKELFDYKMMCFNGKVKCSFVCCGRYSSDGLKVTFFDRNWNIMPFERHYPKSDVGIEKPLAYEKMVELAEKLADGIPFVRVDFYEINGKVYFGEITFYPGNGLEEFSPECWDYELGKWIKLPDGF